MATIESLEIEISASASKASQGLHSLATSLKNLEKVATRIDLSRAQVSLNDLAVTIDIISDAQVDKLSRLSLALESLSRASKSGIDPKAISSLNKVAQSADKAKKSVTGVARGFNTLRGRIMKIAMYRLIRSIMRMITQAIVQGFQAFDKYQFQTKNNKQYMERMTELSFQLQNLKYTFGALSGNILGTLAPVFSGLLSILVTVVNAINNMMASLKGSSSVTKVNTQYLQEYVKSLKETKRELLGIDEINMFKNEIDNEKLFKEEQVDSTQALLTEIATIFIAIGAFKLLTQKTGLLSRAFSQKNGTLAEQTALTGNEVNALAGFGGLAWALSSVKKNALDLSETLNKNPITVEVDSTQLDLLGDKLANIESNTGVQVEANSSASNSVAKTENKVGTFMKEFGKQLWENTKYVFENTIKLLPFGLIGGLTGSPIPAFATGGMPEDGLFYANHNELVGSFTNGRTVVANNQQIIEGISQGVYNAVREAQSNGTEQVTIYLDGNVIYNDVVNKNRKTILRTGTNPMGVR